GTDQVDLDDAAELLGRSFLGAADAAHSCIVHQNIQSAPAGHDPLDTCIDRPLVCNISHEVDCFASGGVQRGQCIRRSAYVIQGQRISACPQRLSNATSDAL